MNAETEVFLYNKGEIVSSTSEWYWIIPENYIWDDRHCMVSPWFTCEDEEWCWVKLPTSDSFTFRIWKKNQTDELKHKYSVYLCLKTVDDEEKVIKSCNADITSNYGAKLSICDASSLRDKAFSENGLVKVFFILQKSIVIKRKRLSRNSLLLGGAEPANGECCSNVKTEVEITGEVEDGRNKKIKLTPEAKGNDRLIQDLKKILLRGELTDVVLKVGSQEFKAHKIFLISRSPVFATMFQHEMAEHNTNIVDIPDCIPASFEVFLHYLYTGQAENMSRDNVLNLYYIADKYRVDDLKEVCVQFLKNNISKENVCHVITLAFRHDDAILQEAGTTYFCNNITEIVKTDSFKTFMIHNPTCYLPSYQSS